MDFYRVAVVARPHGVHGAIKLQPLTDDTARFRGLRAAYLEQGGERRAITLSDIGIRPDAVTLKIEGVHTPEQAEALRGAYIVVDAAHARALPPDTWFVADLIGCKVLDTAGKSYGMVAEVLHTGANDVYELDTGTLIPALKRVLHTVDIHNKRIVVHHDILMEVAVLAD